MFGKKIKRLGAVYYPKIMKIKAEDGAYVKFFFEDGTQGSVNCAFSEMRGGLAGTLTNLGYEVYGDKAAMRGYGTMFQLSGYAGEPIVQRLEIDDGKKVVPVRPAKIQNIYQTLIEGHAKSIADGKPLTGDDAIHNLALCAACHASAQKGGKVISVKICRRTERGGTMDKVGRYAAYLLVIAGCGGLLFDFGGTIIGPALPYIGPVDENPGSLGLFTTAQVSHL